MYTIGQLFIIPLPSTLISRQSSLGLGPLSTVLYGTVSSVFRSGPGSGLVALTGLLALEPQNAARLDGSEVPVHDVPVHIAGEPLAAAGGLIRP